MTFDEWWKSNGIDMATVYEKSAARKGWDAGVKAECERICAAIKEEDDHCWKGDYMLDSDDCIMVARGEWNRPDFM